MMTGPHGFTRATRRFAIASSAAVALAMVSLPGTAASAGAAPITFTAPGTFDASGPSPRAFAPADFNGDGFLDVAAANLNGTLPGEGLPVLLGDGTGTLSAPLLTVSGHQQSALDVAAADFDGDGTQDLAVPTITGSGLSATYRLRIMLGNGDGTFAMGITFPGARSRALAGDVSSDGKADVVFLTKSGAGVPSINVALGNGDGSFGPPVAYSPGFSISVDDIELADVNGDGELDLVFLEGCPTVRINHGDGTFGPQICSTDPQARIGGVTMAVADFTGDGKLDLATGDASGGHVTISKGDGAGTFTFFKQYGGLAYQVVSIASATSPATGRLTSSPQPTRISQASRRSSCP